MLERLLQAARELVHWFLDRSIFAKVFAVSTTLIIMTILVGAIGFFGTSRVNRMVDQVIQKNLLPMTYLYEIKADMIDTQSSVRAGLLNQDTGELQYLSTNYLVSQQKMVNYYTTQLMQMMSEEAADHPEYLRHLDKLRAFNKLWPDYFEISRRALKQYTGGDREHALQNLNDNAKQMAFATGILDELILDYRTTAMNTKQQAHLVYQGVSDSLWLSIFCAIAMGFAISTFLARFLSAQLTSFAFAASRIADGKLGTNIETLGQRDEIGRLGWAFDRMTQNLRDVLGKIAHVTDEVVHHSKHLAKGTDQTSSAAAKVARIMEKISHGTSEQSRQVEQMVASLERSMELTGTVNQTAQRMLAVSEEAAVAALQGKETAFSVRDRIQSVKSTMENNRDAVHQLAQVSTQIEQVMMVVADIADQINLLALNATIEAARAGEHGLGFAVVAESVGQLSDRTHELVKSVQKLSKTAQHEISQVVEAIDHGANEVVVGNQLTAELSETFLGIAGYTETMRALVQKVTQITVEMEDHGRGILGGMQEVSAIALENKDETQQLNDFTQTQNTFATELKDLAVEMKETGTRLSQTMNRFDLAKG